MFNRQRGKDLVESKSGNKWMAQDPGGDKKRELRGQVELALHRERDA